ncbi:MAG: HNH endonuclease [Bacteroidota bacterium]
MSRKVLVLNQDYSPITVCSVQRAFLLVYLDKAELINSVKDNFLRTVSTSFPLPAVIRINKYINIPYRGVVLTRQNIFKRDNHECQYCGSKKELTLDHVTPKSKGGKSTWTNLVTACQKCNARKGDYDLQTAEMALKSKPVKPSYIMFLRNNSETYTEEWLPYLRVKNDAPFI